MKNLSQDPNEAVLLRKGWEVLVTESNHEWAAKSTGHTVEFIREEFRKADSLNLVCIVPSLGKEQK